MRIRIDDLWKVSIGVTIRYKDLTGVYLGKEEWGHVVWTGMWEETIDEWDDDDEVEVIRQKVNYEELVEIKAAKVISLAHEGWTLDKDRRYLDITNDLDELAVLVKVKELVCGK